MDTNERSPFHLQVEDLTPLEFFDCFAPAEVRDLIPYLKVFDYEPSEGPIFHEDIARKGIQLILSGEVRVVKAVNEAEGILLANLRRGDIFGEASMFDSGPHSSRVEAADTVRTVAVTRHDYERLVLEKPHLAVKIAHKAAAVLSDRLRQANEAVLTYAIWSRSLQQNLPPTHWRWYPLSTGTNLLTRDLDQRGKG